MIKRGNNKKKKGFTLIELIIVLAVMAIIALIAIPNFAAVRDNSKVKADKQSCETIERTVLMLVSDETITGQDTFNLKFSSTPGSTDLPASDGKIKGSNKKTAKEIVDEALKEVKAPQAKECISTDSDKTLDTTEPTGYEIVIKDGSVKVATSTVSE